jgi:hypothetical protein
MACNGFDHGKRVKATEEFVYAGRTIKPGRVGTVEEIDRHRHQIDVRFPALRLPGIFVPGLLARNLPAHSFVLEENEEEPPLSFQGEPPRTLTS